jgi:hypothetical protein
LTGQGDDAEGEADEPDYTLPEGATDFTSEIVLGGNYSEFI